MMFTEGSVEVLDELSREPHGQLLLSGGHAILAVGHRRSFPHTSPAGADNQHSRPRPSQPSASRVSLIALCAAGPGAEATPSGGLRRMNNLSNPCAACAPRASRPGRPTSFPGWIE